MDGNFKAEHMHTRALEDDVQLMDGLGFMVKRQPYQDFLAATDYPAEVCLNSCSPIGLTVNEY
ncbi:hypothetical protein JVU11DRAFT_10062 [Chiua virens]|nr:hypothetical protein JVU11DRAFT_10062 [Chiua virens]